MRTPASATRATTGTPAAGAAGTIRVLLVEDNPGDVELIREALADVQEAAPAEPLVELAHVDRLAAGLARLADSSGAAGPAGGGIDVVLLDLSLPDSRGLDTFRKVRGAAPNVPVVVLSGVSDGARAARAVREGAQDYLVKGETDGRLLVRALRYAIERRRAEEERVALVREQAARALAEHRYEEAQEAIRVRDEFLSAAAHDLKTPLAGIKGLAQLLYRRAARANTPETRALLDGLVGIDTSAMRMVALINELLDVARLQMGRPLDLEWRPADLVALVRQVAAAHQTLTDRHRIDVDAAVPALVGMADAARFTRVLDNLVGNAVKYSPHGGTITLTVSQEAGAPDLPNAPGTPATPEAAPASGGGRPRSWAVVAVRDEGIGIAAEDQAQIFERFRRGANVVGRIEGTGVGLANARRIVEAHGGTIGVESQVGRGSTFTVRLPLEPAATASLPPGAVPAAAPPGAPPSPAAAAARPRPGIRGRVAAA